MADTAPRDAEAERREPLADVERKAEMLANHIRASKHFIAFTGAGISTSAGIPDFRGPDGEWTLLAQGRRRTGRTTSSEQAVPTPAHMALVELQTRGILKYLVSQNCDGLHRRSGIPANRISELHGNTNREQCLSCGKEYIRDFRAVAPDDRPLSDHRTDRKCAVCGGDLHDSIIHFGEALPVEAEALAIEHAKKADLCLVLGSSLTVTPANEIPERVGRRKKSKLAICNLQSTPIDVLAEIRVFSEADVLMKKVMEHLEIPIPVFILRRRLVIRTGFDNGRTTLTALGVDEEGTPATFLQSVKLVYNRRVAKSEPFEFNIRGQLEEGLELKLELEFMGHYYEPNLVVSHIYGGQEKTYLLDFDPMNGRWKVERQERRTARYFVDLTQED